VLVFVAIKAHVSRPTQRNEVLHRYGHFNVMEYGWEIWRGIWRREFIVNVFLTDNWVFLVGLLVLVVV
jgi:hypothetical protein